MKTGAKSYGGADGIVARSLKKTEEKPLKSSVYCHLLIFPMSLRNPSRFFGHPYNAPFWQQLATVDNGLSEVARRRAIPHNAVWLPEIALYAWTGPELNRKLVTLLLPGTFLLVYLLVSILRPKRMPKPSAAIFMVLGVIFLGTLAMTIGATILGTGFRGRRGFYSTSRSPRHCYSNLRFHWCNV